MKSPVAVLDDSAHRRRLGLASFGLRRWLALAVVAAALTPAGAFEGFSDESGGHMEATRTALEAVFGAPASSPTLVKTMAIYGIKTYRWDVYRAADMMSDASRDIDSYFFGPLYPHAQTPEFSYKKNWSPEQLEQIELGALTDYLTHFSSWLARVRSLYDQGKDWEASYLLGVLLHSYEDLWAHRGITNGMHLALAKYRDLDVDRAPDRIETMRQRLSSWLGDLPTLLGDVDGPRFLAYIRSAGAVPVPSVKERKRLLHRGRDIFWEGIKYKLFTPSPESSLRYEAAIEWDVDTLDALLHDRTALDAVAALPSERSARLAGVAALLASRGYRY